MRKLMYALCLVFLSQFSFAQLDTAVVLNDDYGSILYAGDVFEIDYLANDQIGEDVTILFTTISHFGGERLGIPHIESPSSVVNYQSFYESEGIDSLRYTISYTFEGNPTDYFTKYGFVIIDVSNPITLKADLDVNNIRATIPSKGPLFWNFDESPEGIINNQLGFEAPIGSEIHSIFSSSLWVGGNDASGNLHLAGEKFMQGPNAGGIGVGNDFFRGPVSDVYDTQFDSRWMHIWKLDQSQIDYHMVHYQDENYAPINDIATWPAHGVTVNGEMDNIAPFYDANGDDLYEPMQGDYPLIRGDQAVFFVINDDRYEHSETTSESLRIQLNVMAYAFDKENDNLKDNTIFIHYDIHNLSNNTYEDTYMGLFVDLEIGFADDDYVGCDVEGSSFFAYNGQEIDGLGAGFDPDNINFYGENPPAQSVTILGGPFMDADDLDNPNGLLDNSINGYGFGDNIIDNERFGLTNFMYFTNGGANYYHDPNLPSEYYNYMQSRFIDNTPAVYGGDGHESEGVGPITNFMFPGDSDPSNWSTDGVVPNGGYNQNGQFWTEEYEGYDPGDRRGLGSCGPFTFEPNDHQEFDVAFIFAQPEGESKELYPARTYLKELITEAQERTSQGEFINLDQNTGKEENTVSISIDVYPNPTTGTVKVNLPMEFGNETVYVNIMDITGRTVMNQNFTSNLLDVSHLDNGVYFIELYNSKITAKQKLIIRK